MINYGVKNDRDGHYYNIFSSSFATKMCGYDESEIDAILFEEDEDGQYWSFQDTGEEDYHLIFPHEVLFNICFAYGVKAEVDSGRGRIVHLSIVNITPLVKET